MSESDIQSDIRLALSLQKKVRAPGSLPNEEELVALAEGSLEASRREQVLEHLAENAVLRQEWAAAMELNDWQTTITDSQNAAEHEVPSSKRAGAGIRRSSHFIRRLRSVFGDLRSALTLNNSFAWAGSSAAAGVAVVAVFLLVLPADDTKKVDDIFTKWQPFLAGNAIDVKMRGASLKVPDKAELQALLLGVNDGLQSLGTWANTPFGEMPALDKLPSSYEKIYSSDFQLGRLVALSAQGCGSSPRAVKLLQTLSPHFSKQLPNTHFKHLAKVMSKDVGADNGVCQVTDEIVLALKSASKQRKIDR